MQVKPLTHNVYLSKICDLECLISITTGISGYKRVSIIDSLIVSQLRTLSDTIIDEAYRCR